jgi:spore coat protein A
MDEAATFDPKSTQELFLARNTSVATSRRAFLQQIGSFAAATAAHAAQASHAHDPVPPGQLLDTNSLARFVDPLPIPPIAKPAGTRPSPDQPASRLPYYRIPMRQFQAKVHRDVPPTTFWGYAATSPGPTIETHRGEAILVEWANDLPPQHFLPIDHTLHGAESGKPDVRTVVHLHGGRTPPGSDGYPEDWFVPGQSATCYYPNQQEAASLFYHDHAMGITRLNTVAGLTGLYLTRDDFEDGLNLPTGGTRFRWFSLTDPSSRTASSIIRCPAKLRLHKSRNTMAALSSRMARSFRTSMSSLAYIVCAS